MKDLIRKILLIMFLGIVIFSCKKKDTEPKVEEPKTTVATAVDFRNLIQKTFDSKIQRASFNAEDGYTFTSSKGVVLLLFPNTLTLNGQLVTGQVDVEFTEFFGRGAMAVCNVTTVGVDANSQKNILTSGGMFHIQVFQNGNKLESNSGMMLKVPASLTGGLNSGMRPFEGNLDNDGNLLWVEMNSEFFLESSDSTYNAFLANFGWFNCDIFIPIPDKKSINLQMPQGYSTENAAVFVSISNMPNSLAYLFTGKDVYPQNETVHLIFMSVKDNQYLYAIKSFVVGNENNVIFTNEELKLTTESNLTEIVNNLP
jgi:hypothetical protein